MPEQSFQEKTEQATPKRREESRKKGEVAKSRELVSIAVLSGGVLYLFFGGKKLFLGLGNLIQTAFSRIPEMAMGDYDLLTVAARFMEEYFVMVLPFMVILCAVAILANMLQTGFVWSVDPLAPKASKINPIEGGKRIASKRSMVELAKSIAKIAVVGWAAYSTLKSDFSRLIPLIYQEDVQIVSLLASASLKVMVRSCWVIAILAVLDYLYQRWEFEQKLKMTKQEVKEEQKQTEGDPLVKSRIRSIQREMARRRMMEEVPRADVVITNPQHLSIAIRYDQSTMSAPSIVAKGAERLAFRIREVASEHQIPLVENKPLAQNLYKLEIGEEIPSQFYQVVAEILAYVYSLKKKEGRSSI
jgi:flagellar biosynthetic protein FlhB